MKGRFALPRQLKSDCDVKGGFAPPRQLKLDSAMPKLRWSSGRQRTSHFTESSTTVTRGEVARGVQWGL